MKNLLVLFISIIILSSWGSDKTLCQYDLETGKNVT